MRFRPNPNFRPQRFVIAALALGIFYWGLYRMPQRTGGAISLDPETSRQLQDESAVMRRYGNWARALPPTLRLHEAYPESHIYVAQLAEIYHHLAQYREETAMWEAFWVRAPLPIEACPQIGDAYQNQGRPKQAISAFERCLALDPNSPDQSFYLARALERNGETERAAAVYAQGLALHPENSDLAVGLARVRLRQGKLEEARALAEKAAARSPKNADALLVLGLLSAREGRRAEAMSYLERGVQVADGYADLHLALASLAEQDANLNLAILHYQKAVQLDKSNTEAAQRLEMLERARP